MDQSEAQSVRKPPISAVLRLHPQGQRGLCGWCGKPVSETTPVRGWLKYWHDACAFEMGVIESPERARAAVLSRDHGICADCGEDWSERYRFAKGGEVATWWMSNTEERAFADQGYYRYTEVIWVSLWHVDHKVPLWKVRHMPPLQRLEFFKLANLVTLCEACHQRKSARETAERFHFKRLAVGGKKRKGPKMKGRGFRKGHRPMRRK